MLLVCDTKIVVGANTEHGCWAISTLGTPDLGLGTKNRESRIELKNREPELNRTKTENSGSHSILGYQEPNLLG